MRLLLDTQEMLWWLLDDPRLRTDTRGLLCASPCVVSVASIWEVAAIPNSGGGAPGFDCHQGSSAQSFFYPVVKKPTPPAPARSSRRRR